jgi:hypothetical protein
MHSYTSEAVIAAKTLQNPGVWCTSVLADIHEKQALSTIFDPPAGAQLQKLDATEPNNRPNVYPADALPSESRRNVRGKPEQTVAWPKHGVVSCSHGSDGTHHTEPIAMWHRAVNPVRSITCHFHELTNHILHPWPASSRRSPGAPEKVLCIIMRCGIVPVSPTGTIGSLPRIL